jgi:hypothetical protein
MNKREIAIASVRDQLDGRIAFDAQDQLAMDIVDNLIRDGIINPSYAGTPDIDEVLDIFQLTFGTTTVIKTDRFAASRLTKRYGAHQIAKVIVQLGKRQREQFAPTVNNLTQLEQKWPSVMRFIQSKSDDEKDL